MTNCLKLEDVPAANILIYFDQEDSIWIAHCLEFDLLEEGEDKVEAVFNLLQVILSELMECLHDGVSPFHPAPAEFWSKWMEAKPFSLRQELEKRESIPAHFAIRELPSNVQNSYS